MIVPVSGYILECARSRIRLSNNSWVAMAASLSLKCLPLVSRIEHSHMHVPGSYDPWSSYTEEDVSGCNKRNNFEHDPSIPSFIHVKYISPGGGQVMNFPKSYRHIAVVHSSNPVLFSHHPLQTFDAWCCLLSFGQNMSRLVWSHARFLVHGPAWIIRLNNDAHHHSTHIIVQMQNWHGLE